MKIIGLINNNAVLNPSFSWDNNGNAFNLKIKYDGKEVINTNVYSNQYDALDLLSMDKEYEAVLTDLETNNILSEITFKTDNYNTNKEDINLTIVPPFMSHMVVQRNKNINIVGYSAPNLLIKVEFMNNFFYGITDSNGKYSINIGKYKENSNKESLIVSVLDKKIELNDILIGDVYLVAGQSNVQWCLKDSDFLKEDIINTKNNSVRFYSMDVTTSIKPIEVIKNGKWFDGSGGLDIYGGYSAISFMLGSNLVSRLNKDIPIGIIASCQGNTNIVDWMGENYYNGSISTRNIHYNSMIYPLRNAEISGVVWYQGCNNSSKGITYKELLTTLFRNYRDLFRNDQLPFYVVQLPCYDGDSGNNFDFSYVREAQMLACESDKNAYLIASADGGDPTFIHPTEKRYIAKRLATSILSSIYSIGDTSESVIYDSHVVDGNRVIIRLKNNKGLYSKDEIKGFELAGLDGKYFRANAVIENNKIVVTSNEVLNPIYVRYGFKKSPFIDIFNESGFAMSPFRTDSYNRNIDLLNYNSEALYYYKKEASIMNSKIVKINNEYGLEVSKESGESYGSLILDKWGSIGFNESKFKLKVIGSNSNAKVLFRLVEGEGIQNIWAVSYIDNFTGIKEFIYPVSEFKPLYNTSSNIDFEAIKNIEITIESIDDVTITILESKFIN